MARACGFCRKEGHIKRYCPMRKAELDAIKTHVPAERKAIHDLLIANGYGVGALVNGSYYGCEDRPAVISTLDFFASSYGYSLIDTYKIKYRQRDRIVLKSFTGTPHSSRYMQQCNDEVVLKSIDYVRVPVLYVHDMSRTHHITLTYSKLATISEHRKRNSSFFDIENHTEVLDPSHESDATDKTFLANVRISDYLVDDSLTTVDGIKSW